MGKYPPDPNPLRDDIRQRSGQSDWYADTAKLLPLFGLSVPVCRGEPCGPGKRCDNCAATIAYLDALYRQREEHAMDLRRFEMLCKVYPEEVREALAPVIVPIIREWETEGV